jgi:hypothetical protein
MRKKTNCRICNRSQYNASLKQWGSLTIWISSLAVRTFPCY